MVGDKLRTKEVVNTLVKERDLRKTILMNIHIFICSPKRKGPR